MTIWESFVLGIIQGLTEFLPVSSSGHLELAKVIFGTEIAGDENLMFTVSVHAATALSTVVVFRKEIKDIIQGLFAFKNNSSFHFSIKIILSMVPAVGVGLFFKDFLSRLFQGNTLLVGSMLLVTSALLYFSEQSKGTEKKITTPKAILIGLAQAIAILPGISRSGATIATALLLKIDRTEAARFSFLMVVPLILGSMVKSIFEGDLSQENVELTPIIVGFLAAFFSGYFACTWMIALVRKSKLSYFALYCLVIGLIALFTNFM